MSTLSPLKSFHLGSLDTGLEHRAELDSHADTCAVSEDITLPIHDYSTPVRVHGYTGDIGHQTARTVNAVMSCDVPKNGQTFMLIVQQALLIPKLKQLLLSPNQMRDHGLRVNDEPKFTLGKPQDHHHTITFHDQKRDDGTPFRIPLALDGVISYFPIRKPTREEWETSLPETHITITADSPEWIPLTDRFRIQEEAMVDMAGELRDDPEHWSQSRIIGALNSIRGDEVHVFYQLGAALNGRERLRTIGSLHTKTKVKKIGPKQLSQNWGISLETAQCTYDVTTQKAICTLTKDHLSR